MISIIITALNEPYLLKTIADILDKTPDEILDEIIVVDDCSTDPVIISHSKVRVIRNETRLGLIRSRNIATHTAISKYIISIDAHCKVGTGWTDEIIAILESDYRTIVIPVTSGLNPDTWEATGAIAVRTIWDWNLDFSWAGHSDNTTSSPSIAGHCFAFSRDWWSELGGFDDGMDQWGGENIEFPLKTWLCGGSVKVARSSIVAHWFKKNFTYDMDGRVLLKNKSRVVNTWFGDYRYYFKGGSIDSIDSGDITKQLSIKSKKSVHDFAWYINNINPWLRIAFYKNKHKNKKVAILGAGPSLDVISHKDLKKFDYIIGVNYVGLTFNCDYNVFHDYKPAVKVLNSRKYHPEQLLAASNLNYEGSERPADEISKEWGIYCLGKKDNSNIKSIDPPFFNHASSVLTAIHIAMYMGFKDITLFGCDGKLSNDGRSHSSIIPEYNGGKYWNINDAEKYFKRLHSGYAVISKAAKEFNVQIFKYGLL